MPVYDYHIPELGLDVTLRRPVGKRDAPLAIKRRTVPDRITISGAVADPYSFDAQYAKGLRTLENRGQLPRDFSKKQLAKAKTIKTA